MVRLALFDVDGTLIRTGGAGVQAFVRVFATEFGIRDGVEQTRFAGRTDPSLVRELFQRHGVPATEANFRRFFERYVFWLDHLLAGSRGGAIPGVREFLRDLQALPQPPLLGLLTGNIRLGAEIKLRRFGLWELFQTGGFGDDHEDRSQIAAIARARGCQALGQELLGEQVLVVGDTPHDIACARAIGARALAVATGGCKLEELKQHRPDWAVADLRHLDVRGVCA